MFQKDLILGSTTKLLHDILVFVPPLLLRELIAFAENVEDDIWKGIFLSLALFLCSCTQTVLLSNYFFRMYTIGLKIRSALLIGKRQKSS